MLENVASVVTALATAVAVSAAVWAGVSAKKLLRVEQQRDAESQMLRQRDSDSTRRVQAAQVSAWWVRSDESGWGVLISNGSDQLIYDVVLVAVADEKDLRPSELHLIPPGQYFLAPEKWPASAFPSVADPEEFCPIMNTEKYQIRTLEFTDSASVRWVRNRRGDLTEVT